MIRMVSVGRTYEDADTETDSPDAITCFAAICGYDDQRHNTRTYESGDDGDVS
jgi:hypothetical protein